MEAGRFTGGGADAGVVSKGTIAAAAAGMPSASLVRGRGAEATAEFNAIRDGAVELIMQQTGMDEDAAGVEYAQRQIDYQNDKKSGGLMTVALDRLVPAVGQLDYNVSQAESEAAKLPTSDLSPFLNVIARGEQQITGHPEYNSLIFYLDAMTQEAAKITTGGTGSVQQLSEGARKEAEKWASQNITREQLHRLGESLKAEGARRITLAQDQLKARRIGGTGQATGGQHEIGEIIEHGGKKYQVTGGDMRDPDVEEVKP